MGRLTFPNAGTPRRRRSVEAMDDDHGRDQSRDRNRATSEGVKCDGFAPNLAVT